MFGLMLGQKRMSSWRVLLAGLAAVLVLCTMESIRGAFVRERSLQQKTSLVHLLQQVKHRSRMLNMTMISYFKRSSQPSTPPTANLLCPNSNALPPNINPTMEKSRTKQNKTVRKTRK